MKLSAKRHAILSRLGGGKLLKWCDGAWGDAVMWWVEGSADKLNDANCHWLVRNGFVAYDVPFNEAPSPREEYWVIAFHITPRGKAALRVNGPKATVLKFRRRAA